MSTPALILISVAIVALSAFFVAVEFSLIAARRHRLEDEAAHSASARAALRSSSELSLLLAGSQLGITVCTLALGALSKPAVHHALTPLLADLGLPSTVADVLAFVLALFIVTFIHLVVGEMMPKSWAIAHPERSAMLLALPMRGFMLFTRPLLVVLNGAANWLLRRMGVEPADEVAAAQDPEGLEQLVEHSTETGTLDPVSSSHIRGALSLREMTLSDLVRPDHAITAVSKDATAADVWHTAQKAGHLRVLIGSNGHYEGAVHVRDTVSREPSAPIADLVHPTATFDESTPVTKAMHAMREGRQHLAQVTREGSFVGVVTLSDTLRGLFPAEVGTRAEPATSDVPLDS